MILALAATGIVIVALLGEVIVPRVEQAISRHRARRRRIPQVAEFDVDPGRERRAEARARQLLKSCVNDEEWAMYRDLGFIRVWGIQTGRRAEPAPRPDGFDPFGPADEPNPLDPSDAAAARARADQADAERRDIARQEQWERMEGFEEPSEPRTARAGANRGTNGRLHRLSRRGDVRDEPYAYLVYPHRPILAYVPQTGRLLNEFCVEFPDETRPYGSARLPDSDDVLAKWMALTGDEQRLIGSANMHLPGRQIDPRQVKRDLWRLRQWERERARGAAAARDSRVPAP
jgi:hypothetical protein